MSARSVREGGECFAQTGSGECSARERRACTLVRIDHAMPDNNLPPPSAQGTLGKTPFPHLLIYVLERQLSGTLELTAPDGERATLLVIGGAPSKIRLSAPVAYLADVLVDEGLIDEDARARASALWEQRKAAGVVPALFGHAIRELGLLDEAGLRDGLRKQLVQKAEHLLNWSGETRFDYYDQLDALGLFGPPPEVTIDPLPLVWSAVRQFPSWDHASATLGKLGSAALRLSPAAVVERLELGPQEMALVSELGARPMRLTDLTATKHASPSVTQLLAYCLLIAKQVDLIHDEAQIAAALAASPMPVQQPSIPPAPQSVRPLSIASAPAAPPSSVTSVSSIPPAPASTSAPFSVTMPGSTSTQVARVQLSKSKMAFAGAVVEERAPIVRIDGRIATPMPGAVLPRHPNTGDLSAAVAASRSAVAQAPLSSPTLPSAMPAAAPIASPPSSEPASSSSSMDAAPPSSQVTAADVAASSTRNVPLSVRGAVLAAAFKHAQELSAGTAGKGPTAEQAAARAKITDRAARIQKENYFEMLGVTKDATEGEIKVAFIELAKQWHPDRLAAALIDLKPEVSKIFSHLGEAHATLTDSSRRGKYMNLLKEGGATPEDQEVIQRVIEATTDFQKAEHYMKRNDFAQAEQWARKAMDADPDQVDYIVLVTWLESMKVENQHEDETVRQIDVMTQAIKKSARNEKAHYYRAQLYRRVGKDREAVADFRTAVDLNPRNIDAAREVRLHNMRKSSNSTIPPGPAGRSSRPPAGHQQQGWRPLRKAVQEVDSALQATGGGLKELATSSATR